ncbi:MAG: 16S rRNA (guanine(966)-N(2))-methyltransferase RsmD [Thermoanaerobaculia bacterium]|nr:MAG: 16S rRNA (guanine(966)-N(2))-methyltransferase RsmD [Thermoanaerobaculia bacterium]
MRIEAGELKGRAVAVPPGARPTEGRVRGALLSIWSERLPDARFLDLFAASGAVGLEALSRGALEAVFVESGREACKVLERNLRLAPAGATRLVRLAVPEALGALAAAGERFDLVFADPPYAWTVTEVFLNGVAAILATGGELALEHSRRVRPPESGGGLVRREARRYGESALAFYAREP